MHFNALITAVSASASFLALTHAAPVNISKRSTPFCPAGYDYSAIGNCTSGFVGCIDSANVPWACGGPRRFFSDCPSGRALGNFYNCSNGFVGCTTDSNVCTSITPPTKETPKPPMEETPKPPMEETPTPPGAKCPSGTWYATENECKSGFVGCTGSCPDVCGGDKRFWGSCPPDHGNYYVCANGFKGCTTETNICDRKLR